MGQENPAGSVTLSTKHGQLYQCSYPNRAEETAKQKQEEREAEEIGIVELLKPMEAGPCLMHTKGWWSYELCFGKDIKQYHMENGVIAGDILYLGLYESEFDWNNGTEAAKKRKSRMSRYHSQQYVNGTICDLTGQPRRVEVRFQCEEGKGDYISTIDESETCVYVINVKTTKICHHPYLKPPTRKMPVPITCNPLLTSEQYDDYLAQQAAEQQAYEERQREKDKYLASHNIQEPQGPPEDSKQRHKGTKTRKRKVKKFRRKGKKGTKVPKKVLAVVRKKKKDADKVDSERMVSSAMDALEKLFTESLSTGLHSVLTDENEKAFEPGDETLTLRKHIYKMLTRKSEREETNVKPGSSHKGETGETGASPETEPGKAAETVTQQDTESPGRAEEGAGTPEEKAKKDEASSTPEGDLLDATDKEAVDAFEKELKEITRTDAQKEHIAHHRENIASAVQAQFSDIVEEAQAEMGNEEGVEIDKKEAFAQLAKTLNKLMNKLEHTEKEISDIDERIGRAEQLREEQAKRDRSEDAIQDDNAPDDDPISFSTNDDELQQDTDTPSQTSAAHIDSAAAPSQDPAVPAVPAAPDDRIRVRVLKVKEKQQPEGASTESEPSDAAASSSGQLQEKKKELNIPAEQKAKMETALKDKLEKSGLDTSGRKITVKILSGYPDDEEAAYALSDAESSAFNKILIAVIGGSNEEEQELEHQREMEQNYNFVWGKSRPSQTPTHQQRQLQSSGSSEEEAGGNL